MKLKARVESLDDVPEIYRDVYVKGSDGAFYPQIEAVEHGTSRWALEDVAGLKLTLGKVKGQTESLAAKLREFGELTPEAARDMVEKLKTLQGKDLTPDEKVRERLEALKKELETKHATEIGKRDEERQELSLALERALIDAEVSRLMATEKDLKGSPGLILPHVRGMTRITRKSPGEYITQVVGEDGHARVSPTSGKTGDMDLRELLLELKGQETFAPAFSGTQATGSDANGHFTQGRSTIILTSAQARDPQAYRAAKEEAAKSGRELQIAD